MEFRSNLKGFTLVELLIVVAIIAILAAIAVPNFLESQTRAKVARVKNDIRTVVTGLEAYRVDHNRYPPCGNEANFFDGAVGLKFITTPVAFVNDAAITDLYVGKKSADQLDRELPFFSYGSRTHDDDWASFPDIPGQPMWFIVASKGPNLLTQNYWDAIETDDTEAFLNTNYDPTNGIISDGNIYRSGGDIRGDGAEAAYSVNQFKTGSTY